MNIKQAKEIRIENFLAVLGSKPKLSKRSDLWYLSPLREEKTPSFKVNQSLNTRYDFGLGAGGTIIDLVCDMFNEDVRGALARLEHSNFSSASRIRYTQTRIESKKMVPVIESVKPLKNYALLSYLKSRAIDLDIAKLYLNEVYYSYKGDRQIKYGIGLKNDSGGYEIRNQFFKGFVGDNKDISSFNLENSESAVVFEGFIDFLSFLSQNKSKEYKNGVIIMNSTNLKNKVLEALNNNNISKIYLFLDHDEAGKACLEYFNENLTGSCLDKSEIYAGFNDYNDFRIAKASQN